MQENNTILDLPPEFNYIQQLREDAPQTNFQIYAMPPVLREMTLGIDETTGTDITMASISIISAVSYCFTNYFKIQGNPDHTESPALYSFIIADPSERKSPVVKLIKASFVDFEINCNKEHAEDFYRNKASKNKLIMEADKLEKDENSDVSEIARLRTEAEQI